MPLYDKKGAYLREDQQPLGTLYDTSGQYSGAPTAPPGYQPKSTLGKTAKFASDVGLGATKQIVQTGIGLGQLAPKVVGGLAGVASKLEKQPTQPNFAQKVSTAMEGQKQFFNTPETNTTAGKIGKVVGDVAILSDPTLTGASRAAKAGIKGTGMFTTLKGATGAAKPLSYVAQKVLLALPGAATGTAYGATQGQTTKGALKTGATFGALDMVGDIAGDAWRSIKGDLTKNLSRAFGGGKTTLSGAAGQTEKYANAMQTINNLSKDGQIMVGKEGLEQPFNPEKATWQDMTQALAQAKDKVYQAYSEVAANAGDQGANFSTSDFNKIIDNLNSLKQDSGPSFASKAQAWINYINQNFGSVNPKDGKVYFSNVDFGRMQDFIQKVNVDVNPLSDKAGATVSQDLSQNIRGIMDGKIAEATGEQYQALRDQYANLKSIEGSTLSQWKKAMAGTGRSGISRWMERFGTVDAIAGLLTHGTSEMLRGLGLVGISEVSSYLKSSETALQTAFKLIGQGSQVAAPTVAGTLGKSLLQSAATAANNPPTQ